MFMVFVVLGYVLDAYSFSTCIILCSLYLFFEGDKEGVWLCYEEPEIGIYMPYKLPEDKKAWKERNKYKALEYRIKHYLKHYPGRVFELEINRGERALKKIRIDEGKKEKKQLNKQMEEISNKKRIYSLTKLCSVCNLTKPKSEFGMAARHNYRLLYKNSNLLIIL